MSSDEVAGPKLAFKRKAGTNILRLPDWTALGGTLDNRETFQSMYRRLAPILAQMAFEVKQSATEGYEQDTDRYMPPIDIHATLQSDFLTPLVNAPAAKK